MARAAMVAIMVMCFALPLRGENHRAEHASVVEHPKYWQGKLQIVEIAFGQKGGEGSLTQYIYDVYQSDKAMVRRELAYMNRNPIAEVGRDVQLIDYDQGIGLAYDQGRSRAIRYHLENPGTSRPVEDRIILGYKCTGLENEWEDAQREQHTRQIWTATEGFRAPLLKIQYGVSRDNQLQYLIVEAMTKLEPVAFLEPFLFEPPPGLNITDGEP
jgi:hypothetical protein